MAPSEDTATTDRGPLGGMWRKCWTRGSSAPALMSIVQLKWCSVSSDTGLSTPDAALETRMSSPPQADSISSNMRDT